MKVARSVDQA